MVTTHMFDYLWAAKQMEKGKYSTTFEEESNCLNSAVARLNNVLRHEPRDLTALLLKARASKHLKNKQYLYNLVLDINPKTKLRSATVYMELAEAFFNDYLAKTDENYNPNHQSRHVAIFYAKEAIRAMSNNTEIVDSAIGLLEDIGYKKLDKFVDEVKTKREA